MNKPVKQLLDEINSLPLASEVLEADLVFNAAAVDEFAVNGNIYSDEQFIDLLPINGYLH